jgi:DNA-binding response OmpR family regulator
VRLSILENRKLTSPLLVTGDARTYPHIRRVARHGRPVRLTSKEFGVLEALMPAAVCIVRAGNLLEKAWAVDAHPAPNRVRARVADLRRKPGDQQGIETLIGAGYPRVTP